MTDNKQITVAIKLKEGCAYPRGSPNIFSLVLGFRKYFYLPKGFRKEKKVEKHYSKGSLLNRHRCTVVGNPGGVGPCFFWQILLRGVLGVMRK